MTSRDKGNHRYDRLTWTWSRNECATQIITSQRVTGLRPPQPPLDPIPRTHINSHQSEEAAPPAAASTGPNTEQRHPWKTGYPALSFCCGLCGSATQAKTLSPHTGCCLIWPLFLPVTLISLSVGPVRWAEPGTSPSHMGNLRPVGSPRPHLD